MKDNKRILAIIPARGGSKGLPKKNIIELCGKPLIAWTIENALVSRYIDQIVVSTENQEIAEISKQYGAQVVERPQELARDDSPTIDAIFQVINWFEKRREYFDIIILLEPTSPLRKEKDIDNAIELFSENIDKADSLISVGEVHLENPHITKKIENGYLRPLIEIGKNVHQRQQLPKVFFPYGVIYLALTSALTEYKTFYQERTIPYFIERWQNYEIDDIYDFICIESILRKRLEISK